MENPKKNLFCEICGGYPDEIETQVAQVTKRHWNGICYENGFISNLPDTEIHLCGICGTILEEKDA